MEVLLVDWDVRHVILNSDLEITVISNVSGLFQPQEILPGISQYKMIFRTQLWWSNTKASRCNSKKFFCQNRWLPWSK